MDINIKRVGNGFETGIYRKPTFTGLTTKFTSFLPIKYKRNLVVTLTSRAFQICSNFLNFHNEIIFIRKLLFNNGFPYKFTDTYVGTVLNNVFSKSSKAICTVDRKIIYFSIPYMGSHSFKLRKELSDLLGNFYPQIKLRVVFNSLNSINKFFKYKDKVPNDLRAGVVYKYECGCCSATYVGKCVRHITARINEHLGRSPRTGNLLVKPPYSAIREHRDAEDHQMQKENFSILASSSDDTELLIMEALFQNQLKPSLGRSSYELLCF